MSLSWLIFLIFNDRFWRFWSDPAWPNVQGRPRGTTPDSFSRKTNTVKPGNVRKQSVARACGIQTRCERATTPQISPLGTSGTDKSLQLLAEAGGLRAALVCPSTAVSW